jgi:ABC-type transport system involved in multi-copper enzyme maturation permease subunit
MMLNLIRAEWFKLVRRPMTWVLLGVFLGFLLLNLGTEFLLVALHVGAFGEAIQFKLLSQEQADQFRLMISLPGIFGAALGQANSIGGICAIVLAAGAMGSEYSWGTLRTQLARQPDRGRYLVAKIATLLLLQFCGIAIGLVVGTLLALLFGGLLGATGGVAAGDLLQLPLGMLRALYVLQPYVMVTLACCVLGRSVLAGAAGGFLFLILDVGLGAFSFLSQLSGLLGFLLSLVAQPNVNSLIVLNSQSFGLSPMILTRSLDPAILPSPLQATVVIGLYSALFFFYTYRSLLKRDITGAA